MEHWPGREEGCEENKESDAKEGDEPPACDEAQGEGEGGRRFLEGIKGDTRFFLGC